MAALTVQSLRRCEIRFHFAQSVKMSGAQTGNERTAQAHGSVEKLLRGSRAFAISSQFIKVHSNQSLTNSLEYLREAKPAQ